MKNNGPVTSKESPMEPGSILVSKTNLKGAITYCNRAFIDISGYTETELIGKNHNLVRHPDMPPEAFADLWGCVKTGKPWSGIVKNRCKNGDHYWVSANVTPIFKNGAITEYMSVRTLPTRQEVSEAEALYKEVQAKRKTLKPTVKKGIGALWGNISTSLLMYGAIAGALAMQLTLGAMVVMDAPNQLLLATLGAEALLTVVLGIAITRRSITPLKYAVKKLDQISEGNYFDWVTTTRNDEFGELLVYIRSMQTQLGFEVQDTKEQAMRTNRIKTALDNTSGNIMIADANHHITYFNKSLEKTFNEVERDIQQDLPNFNVETLLGSNIDIFHKNPGHQRAMLDAMSAPLTANFKINNTHLKFVANPIFDENNKREGTVVEWINRTAQIRIESEIQHIVEQAKMGELDQRLAAQSEEDFINRLSATINELLDVNETVITESIRAISALANGDLTKGIEGEYHGAFDELKQNVNNSIVNLTDMIQQIRRTTDGVVTGVTEISEGNRSLSRRTEQQVSTLERSAAAMEQINGTIQQSAENAIEASQVAAIASDKAKAGGEIVEKAAAAMADIKEANKRIATITDLIDSIAFQTNLLALNASVEAAHAAEHGGGFSVVASEVRSLAQRSANAAKEVQDLVKDTLAKVNTGTQLVTESGHTLSEIIDESQRVSQSMAEISNASQEQATGAQQVNQSLVELDHSTQENAALSEETTAANMNVLAEIQQLSELVEVFNLPTQSTRHDSYHSSQNSEASRPEFA